MNYLGIDKQRAMNVVDRLNDLLSNYQVYYQNLRNFHWNIKGDNFFELHVKFEELYDDARVKIDEIAERILTLRLRPVSKMSAYIERADINEAGEFSSDYEMVEEILKNHRILIENMRAIIDAAGEIEDEGTIDMIGGFLAEIEKTSWMLDAWRERKNKMANA